MADLMKIFGPIAQWNEMLRDIQKIGIDVMGTAIDHHGKMHRDIIDLVSFAARTQLDVMLQFISTQPLESEEALHMAGVKTQAMKSGVVTKEEFYASAAAKGENVVVLDDSARDAQQAAVHINPKDDTVKTYLHEHGYRHPERYDPK